MDSQIKITREIAIVTIKHAIRQVQLDRQNAFKIGRADGYIGAFRLCGLITEAERDEFDKQIA